MSGPARLLPALCMAALAALPACSSSNDPAQGASGGASGAGGSSAASGAGGSSAASGAGGSSAASGAGGSSAASGAGGSSAASGAGGSLKPQLPPAHAQFDYQLGGAYTPPTGVRVVSRDRGDAPAPGLYNLCYVNGFQIQPGEAADWEANHADLILRDASGNAVVDTDWNEMLVDLRTEAKRQALAAIVGAWIQGCAAAGFDAADIDNLDSYTRSNGLLTEDDAAAYMSLLTATAHAAGLAAAQKNASELLGRVTEMKTDFAVVEECGRYGECDSYVGVYGALVFDIEYRQQDLTSACAASTTLSIVLRDRDLSPSGSSTYVYATCP